MKIHSCRFDRAAFRPDDEPRAPGPDVVFLGRSNVGKSSLINCLLGVKGLARTSSQPGRTQTANFYRVNEEFHFVDLPGYGFARAPKAVRDAWGPMVEGFLERRRERIALAVLVVDARRPPTELDGVMRDWLVARQIEHLVVATKSDKLSGNELTRARRDAVAFAQASRAEAVMASAERGTGTQEIWRHLDRALARPEVGR